MHGYELMRRLEEESGGLYTPSPGSVYPTLQLLEDQGYVSSTQEDGKRVYRLTAEGRAFLDEHGSRTRDIFGRFVNMGERFTGSAMREVTRSFIHLAQVSFERATGGQGDPETLARVKAILDRAAREIETAWPEPSPAASREVRIMLELAFLGIIVLAFYRRLTRSRGWSRADLWRALTKLERRLRRGVVPGRQAGPGLMAQCAADLKSLGEDMFGVVSPEARARLRRSVRNRTSRPARGRVHRSDGAMSDASDPAFARLQRRYLDGRISLEEYVEAARRLRSGRPPRLARSDRRGHASAGLSG